jgi:antitoxin (DNA-binding transcriptional repressor) of toxin-antitoxin stability system
MSLTFKIGEAKARFSELIAKAEAGEEVIIACGHEPVVRLVRLPRPDAFSAVVAEVKAARAGRQPGRRSSWHGATTAAASPWLSSPRLRLRRPPPLRDRGLEDRRSG